MLMKKAFAIMRGGALVCAAALAFFVSPCLAAVNDAGILNNQGVELYERGQADGAIKSFLQALEMDPMNASIHANLGYAYQAVNNHQMAVNSFKRALSLNPTDLDMHNSMGVSLFNLGLSDRAAAEWEFVLAQDPMNTVAASNISMMKHPEIADEIAYEAQSAILSPVERNVLVSRGLTGLFSEGKSAFKREFYNRSVEIFTKIIQAKPTSKYSHYYLGLSYAKMNKPVPAMKYLREYLILESYPPENASIYKEAKRTFKTLQGGGTIEPRVSPYSGRSSNVFQQGKDAYRTGDYFRAINLLNQVYNYKPDSYPTNYYLGLSYREVGDRERSVFHLSKCLLAGPTYRTKDEAQDVAEIMKTMTQ